VQAEDSVSVPTSRHHLHADEPHPRPEGIADLSPPLRRSTLADCSAAGHDLLAGSLSSGAMAPVVPSMVIV
jgi:hypothetical protein